jgi:hypothetical protein
MTPEEFARVSVALRWEFRRHHFSERERLILDWMLDCSLVCGHDEMLAPTLDSIGELAHISRGNVHTILEDLKGMHVITTTESGGITRYRITADRTQWKCRERLAQPALKIALANIRASNGLDTDFFTRAQVGGPRNFQPAPLDYFFAPAVSDSGTVPDPKT